MKIWKVKEIISYIEADGWYLVKQKRDNNSSGKVK
jgi:predicted RNA binding protein YcfA (HicA-like mRNA interferase family)